MLPAKLVRATLLALLFLAILPPSSPPPAAEHSEGRLAQDPPVANASTTTTAMPTRCEELRETEVTLAQREFALLEDLESSKAQAWQREAWKVELLSIRDTLDDNDAALTENNCPSP